MNINLHIERLVLDGINIASGQSRLMQAGLTTELTRMLRDRGLSPGLAKGINLSSVSTDGIEFAGSTTLKQLGRKIAQTVYGEIGHE